MAEVTYSMALSFVAADDGIAAGEPTECPSMSRWSCMRSFSRASRRDMLESWQIAGQAIPRRAISAMRYLASNVSTQLMLKPTF